VENATSKRERVRPFLGSLLWGRIVALIFLFDWRMLDILLIDAINPGFINKDKLVKRRRGNLIRELGTRLSFAILKILSK